MLSRGEAWRLVDIDAASGMVEGEGGIREDTRLVGAGGAARPGRGGRRHKNQGSAVERSIGGQRGVGHPRLAGGRWSVRRGPRASRSEGGTAEGR